MAETEQIKSKSNRLSWILLIIALLLVVVFVCVVLFMNKKTNRTDNGSSVLMTKPVLSLSPDNISMLDKEKGSIEKQEIKISVVKDSESADIVGFELDKPDASINLQNNCMSSLKFEMAPCSLTLIWTVEDEGLTKENDVIVKYVAKGQDKSDEKNIYIMTIPVKLTSVKKIVELEPAAEPEPIVEEREDVFEESELDIEPENKVQDIPEIKIPEVQPVKTREEACYEFARPGYDLDGRPMGWIKADAGKYYFHPYSDLKCNAPTGEYDQFTGYIYSISDPKKQIGTDEASINANAKTSVVPNLSAPRFSARLNQSVEESLNLNPAVVSARKSAAERFVKDSSIINGMQIKGTKNTKTDGLVPPSVMKSGDTDQVSSLPRNRKYVLRQFKPIPAVIVSDIRMDKNNLGRMPVQAVVERNVYSDDERTIIIPTGTLLLGQVSSKEIPGRYTSVGTVEIDWYKFVRPDGAEFNFNNSKPFSGDAQGRIGVLGRGTNDYLQEFMFPLLTSLVPAAINMINPVTSKFVNQLDLDDNTVLLSGQQKSSEKAKAEIISAWNDVANKMVSDVLNSNVPPFTIPAGTRITVYSPKDLMLYVYTEDEEGNSLISPNDTPAKFSPQEYTYSKREYNDRKGDDSDHSDYTISSENIYKSLKTSGLADKYKATQYAQQETAKEEAKKAEKEAAKQAKAEAQSNSSGLKCSDGSSPDSNGCCTGETYEMIDGVPACCPADETADCFDPLK